MSRLLLVFFVFVLFTLSLQAQVTVTLRSPVPNTLKLGDLWQVVVNTAGPVRIRLVATVNEQERGRVLRAESAVLDLAAGTHVLGGRRVEPVAIREMQDVIDNRLSRVGTFPDGEYSVCVDVVSQADGSILATDCIEQSVATAVPPVLLTPYNGSDVTEEQVLWTWFMQPAVSNGDNIICDLVVVEVLPRQTPEEALRNNPKVIERTGLTASAWQTNFATRDFQPGTTYAWRIIARIDRRIVSESEIWTFTYADPEKEGDDTGSASGFRHRGSGHGGEDVTGNAAAESAADVQEGAAAPEDAAAAREDASGNDGGAGTDGSQGEAFVAEDPRPKPLEFSVSTRTTFEYSDRQALLSRVPRQFVRTEIDPTITLFGAPLQLNLLLSTEDGGSKTNLDRGAFQFDRDSPGMRMALRQRIGERVEELQRSALELRNDTLRMFQQNAEEHDRELQELYDLQGKDLQSVAQELVERGLLSESEAFLLDFPAFGFGNVAPTFTELSLSGVTIGGGMVEYNPGNLYLAVALGKLTREMNLDGAVDLSALPEDVDLSQPQFFRNLYSARIGYGRRNGSHVIFTGIYAEDDEQSRIFAHFLDSTASVIGPQVNYVSGVSGRLLLDSIDVLLEGEINTSMLNDNTRSGVVQNRRVSGFVSGLVGEENITSASEVDVAYAGRASWLPFERSGRLSGSLRMVGPGYRSVGVAGLRNDIFRADIQYDHLFLGRQVSAGVLAGYEETGFVLAENGKGLINRFGASTELRFRGYPTLQFAWVVNQQRQAQFGDVPVSTSRVHQYTAASRYVVTIGGVRSGTFLSAAVQESEADDPSAQFRSTMLQLQQRLALAQPFSVGLSVSRTSTEVATEDGSPEPVIAAGLSVAYDPHARWLMNMGVDHTTNSLSTMTTLYASWTLVFAENWTLEARADYSDFTDSETPELGFTETVFRTILSFRI